MKFLLWFLTLVTTLFSKKATNYVLLQQLVQKSIHKHHYQKIKFPLITSPNCSTNIAQKNIL